MKVLDLVNHANEAAQASNAPGRARDRLRHPETLAPSVYEPEA